MSKSVQGVLAAVLTPRSSDGHFDEGAFERNATFLVKAGLDGIVINGATGEFATTDPAEFHRMLAIVAGIAGPGKFIACIGSNSVNVSLRMGEAALAAGAKALLLPAPYFYRYSQQDLICLCLTVAQRTGGPVLLYNLPQFVTAFETSTVLALLDASENIVGIKDSSGSLEILRVVTASKFTNACRIVGNDTVLIEALKERVCDGVISGVGGVLPELIAFLGSPTAREDEQRYNSAVELLQEVLDHLHRLPVPWGLKWIAEFRGFGTASFPIPLSDYRIDQGNSFRLWFDAWWARACSALCLPSAAGGRAS